MLLNSSLRTRRAAIVTLILVYAVILAGSIARKWLDRSFTPILAANGGFGVEPNQQEQ